MRITEPIGNYWGAFPGGELWPVEVLHINVFGTKVRATHPAAPQGETWLPNAHVYDSDFNRPKAEH